MDIWVIPNQITQYFLGSHGDHLRFCSNLAEIKAGKIRFSGAQKSMLFKAKSGERCVPCNSVHLVTLCGTCVCLTVYLIVHEMEYVMDR